MFPVSDFNFVYCGMATFAATMGSIHPGEFVQDMSSTSTELPTLVAESSGDSVGGDLDTDTSMEDPFKSQAPSLSSSSSSLQQHEVQNTSDVAMSNPAAISIPSPSETVETNPVVGTSTVARGSSLKRKRMHDHDENNVPLEYPYNLAALYPNKRCKTPPQENEEEEKRKEGSGTVEEKSDVGVDSSPKIAEETQTLPKVEEVITEPAEIPQKSVDAEPQPTQTSNESTSLTADTHKIDHKPEDKENKTKEPLPPTPTPKLKPSSGFESFASNTPVSFSFGNGTLASGANVRPVWSTSTNFRKRHSFVDKLDGDPTEKSLDEGESSAFALESRRDTATHSTSTHVTGEEDEDVRHELKGVKLFVKRGSQDFSSGVLGQVKYLADRKTENERVLFRREPLWKISMNTRLQPTVRCTFDPQECVLRLLLAESSEIKAQEVVVYALKPGRFCSRKDFQAFAESVMSSASLKKTETSETVVDATRQDL
ncbi:hypothetical protein GYMLUDRAFT_247270 [Collybiopsis luxurians FD-317 M1]|uniref:RanBD1 domain-containing protein n=1 Tax=Collybiopsis luxurians FD-317 M1 TaxID=944289 RepID=A0A0D0BPL8_9AGAR|nr:hypothetical protein GYMLUDRAFT_247270 [Collybiopsis luxurians FD-317 M1]